MLEPPNSKRLAQQVYEQLFDLILRGELKPGEKLTSERKMADQLGISRTTVREAVRKLVERGLAENRQGAGTFVKSAQPAEDNNPLLAVLGGRMPTLLEILEVRAPLEVSGAALAARRATEKDVALLEQSIARMKKNMETGPDNADEDVCFHMNIAYATNNVVHINLMRGFYDLLHYGIDRMFQPVYGMSSSPLKQYEEHFGIFAAIKKHNPEAARKSMQTHLTKLLNHIKNWEASGGA